MKNLILIPLLLILFSVVSCRNRELPAQPENLQKVKVTGIVTRDISIPVHAAGLLTSTEELKLSFKTGGIIRSVNAREGNRVRKGQLLATLDMSEISAGVKQAENGYEKALRDYTRAENLYLDSVATLEQKQNAATALDVAKASLSIAKFNLQHSSITAPANGVILKQLARQNELVSAGYPVFLFGQSGKYWKVKSGLADRDVVRINRGDSAVIAFDAWPGIRFTAVVDQVGEMADPYTGTYEAELLLDPSGYKLNSGFVADVTILPVVKRAFTVVPVGSIVEADGQSGYVYALTDSSTVRKLRVRIENLSDDAAAVTGIPDGIKSVVTEGAAYLRNGMKVFVAE